MYSTVIKATVWKCYLAKILYSAYNKHVHRKKCQQGKVPHSPSSNVRIALIPGRKEITYA